MCSFLASENVARTAALLTTYGKKKKKASDGRRQWLRECYLAFSPTLNMLVAAFDQKIVVSTGSSVYFHLLIRSSVYHFSKIFQLELKVQVMKYPILPHHLTQHCKWNPSKDIQLRTLNFQ